MSTASSNPTPQETDNSESTFCVSAIQITLEKESGKTIRSIKLCHNDRLLRDVEKAIHAGNDHREEFEPFSVSLQDHISATISYSTKWTRTKMTIDISLDDPEYVREQKEKGERLCRKMTKKVEVLVTVHQGRPPLVATTAQIIHACSKFRLLIIGNTGVGKSSLINKVFGVQEVEPSSNKRGIAHIDQEFISPSNERLVIHDSLGFEGGDEGNMKIVQDFVASRREMPEVTDQLHAIWLCLEIPYAGGRLLETGVEKFLEDRKKILGDIPLVVVLTKVDLLDRQLEIDLPEGDAPDDFKIKYMKEHCITPLCKAAGDDVTHATVSTVDGYSKSLSELLKHTEANMIQYGVGEAPRIMAIIAQRISVKEKIELSISMGRKKYWNILKRDAAFRGRNLDECLNVIREEIIQIWNFNDPDKCLMDNLITTWLLRNDNPEGDTDAATSSNGAWSAWGRFRSIIESKNDMYFVPVMALKTAFPLAMVYDKYQEATKDVKILMAYIVDLLSLMQIVFFLVPDGPVTRQATILAGVAYDASRKEVHNRINEWDASGVLPGGSDSVLAKVEHLIWLFTITDGQIQELRQSLNA